MISITSVVSGINEFYGLTVDEAKESGQTVTEFVSVS